MHHFMTTSVSVSIRSAWTGALQGVLKQEKLIHATIADTFFTESLTLGRLISILTVIWSPWSWILGVFSIIGSHQLSEAFTNHKTLRKSRLFALNGWFLGLAAANCIGSWRVGLVGILAMAPICVIATVASHRFLKTWNLPVIVLPYSVSFWIFQLATKNVSGVNFSYLTPQTLGDVHFAQQILMSCLLGFGQIFFCPDLHFSALVLSAILITMGRQSLHIVIGAVVPTLLATLVAGTSHWAVTSGLTSFGGILLSCAYHSGFTEVSKIQYMLLLLISGVLEIATVNVAGVFGLYGLSAGFVILLWVSALCVETRRAHEVPDGKTAIMTW